MYHITFFPIRVQLNLLKRLNWCFSFHLWSLINISENLHVIGYLKIWQTAVCSKCCVHRGPFGPFNHTPHPKRRQELWHCKEKNLIGDNFFPTWGHSGEGWLWNPQCFSRIYLVTLTCKSLCEQVSEFIYMCSTMKCSYPRTQNLFFICKHWPTIGFSSFLGFFLAVYKFFLHWLGLKLIIFN